MSAAEESTRPVVAVTLSIEKGVEAGTKIAISSFPVVVGRGADADIKLKDDPADPTISRRHVRIGLEGARVVLHDLSTNGTWIGEQLMAPGTSIVLQGGEPIWLGPRTCVTVQLMSTERPPQSPGRPNLWARLMGQSAEVATTMEVRALGDFSVSLGGAPLPADAWEGRKAPVLLVYLAEQPHAVTAERILEALWPDQSEGRHALQTALTRVRKAFKVAGASVPDPLKLERRRYSLNPACALWYDVSEFEMRCRDGQRFWLEGKTGEATRNLQSAVQLHREAFMDGFTDEWVVRRRSALDLLQVEARVALGRMEEKNGRYREAMALYHNVLDRDPCQEAALTGTLRCLTASGRRDDAVRQYHDAVKTLKRVLNVGPSDELVALHETITRGDQPQVPEPYTA